MEDGGEDERRARRRASTPSASPGLSDGAGHRSAEEDAEEQTGHDLPDDGAALAVGGQAGGEGHEDLRHDRRQTDQGEEADQHPQAGRQRGTHEKDGKGQDHAAREAPPIDQVTDRHDEGEADGVADLGGGDRQGGGALRRAEVVGDRVEQRLCVVQVGDGQPAAMASTTTSRGGIPAASSAVPAGARRRSHRTSLGDAAAGANTGEWLPRGHVAERSLVQSRRERRVVWPSRVSQWTGVGTRRSGCRRCRRRPDRPR